MERRFRVRLDELLDAAVVEPAVLRGALGRLERFLEPFAASLATAAQRTHTHPYVAGLLSDLRRKNAEGIAYSCCVPGLLPPLALSRLYDRGIRVQLVDGAVHDNHGLDGLFDHACTDFVISDGSEQMRAEIDPAVQWLP